MIDVTGILDAAWRWLATDTPVLGLALCRIGVAIAVLVDAALLARDARVWLHPVDGVIRAGGDDYPETWLFRVLRRLVGGRRVVTAALAVQVALASLVLVGAASQLACAALFLTTSALHQRNPHILYGGDGLARVMLLLLAVSPCGAALSVDAYAATGELALDASAAPWGMRLLQLELCALYLYNFLLKADMKAWREGLALYFVWRNPDLTNVPVPRALRTVAASKLATWGTLALELALAPGLLVDETRPVALALAIAFHAAIALTLSVHLFSYLMLAGLCVFVSPVDLGIAPTAAAAAPVPTAAGWIAVAACALYAVYVAFWDPPSGRASPVTRAVRRAVRALPRWAPLHRSWRLFIGDPPGAQQLRVRVSVFSRARGVERLAWDPRLGLHDPAASPRRPSHRARKFVAALTAFPHARELFGDYLLRALDRDDLRAVMIDVTCDPIPAPAGHDRDYEHLWSGTRSLFTRLLPGPNDSPEQLYLDVTRELGATAREASTVATLLMLGLQQAVDGGDDAPYLARVRDRWDGDLGAASPDDIRDLRALCGALDDPHTCCRYASLIDGLEDPELKPIATRRLGWDAAPATNSGRNTSLAAMSA